MRPLRPEPLTRARSTPSSRASRRTDGPAWALVKPASSMAVTAAAGATAYAGIPLTHRDSAQSAVFITGHCKQDGEEPDWASLAASNQTLVIYMGLIASPVIQQRLLSHGRAPTTPVALIERGTTAEQKVWRGELQHLAELASGAASPSLIVVGEVAALADQLSWFRGEVASGKEQ